MRLRCCLTQLRVDGVDAISRRWCRWRHHQVDSIDQPWNSLVEGDGVCIGPSGKVLRLGMTNRKIIDQRILKLQMALAKR